MYRGFSGNNAARNPDLLFVILSNWNHSHCLLLIRSMLMQNKHFLLVPVQAKSIQLPKRVVIVKQSKEMQCILALRLPSTAIIKNASDNGHFRHFFDCRSVLNIAVNKGSCWMTATGCTPPTPQQDNQLLYCPLLLCGKLLTQCTAWNQITVAHGMMEEGQLLTDFISKTTLASLAALFTDTPVALLLYFWQTSCPSLLPW